MAAQLSNTQTLRKALQLRDLYRTLIITSDSILELRSENRGGLWNVDSLSTAVLEENGFLDINQSPTVSDSILSQLNDTIQNLSDQWRIEFARIIG